MNTNSNQGTLDLNNTTETQNNVTVLPPVLEPKKRVRKPLSEEEKAERAAAEKAKRKEIRQEVVKELLASMNEAERAAATDGFSDEFFSMQEKVAELVDIRYKAFKKSTKGTKKPRKAFDVLDYLKRKMSEIAFDLMHTEFKSKKTGEVRKLSFTIDQWKEAGEFGFLNPKRRETRVRKSKADKVAETK